MCILIRSADKWIGLIPGPTGPCNCQTAGTSACTACRRSWVWSDGTILDYDAFHAWFSADPESDQRCARLSDFVWIGTVCRYRYSFICKIGKLKERQPL